MINYDLFGKAILPEIEIIRIPYQGSKNSIALDLFAKMLEIKPKARYFVDLFGGGGAMSFTALQLGLKVIYNEKQTSLVTFIKFILDRIKSGEHSQFGLFPEEFYNFINREEFKILKVEDSIKGQFARICYSFGNNQRDYAFGKKIETPKNLAHNIVVFQCKKSLKEFNEISNLKIEISNSKNWNQRRLDLMIAIRESTTLDRSYIKQLEQLKQLQQLEQLQRLQRLQQLQQLDRLTILNLDFQDVVIDTLEEETIVYLDPPYRNTAAYLESALHNDIDNYFRNLPFLAFMSEYDAPFTSILEIKKKQLFCNTKEKGTFITEKLFINKTTLGIK